MCSVHANHKMEPTVVTLKRSEGSDSGKSQCHVRNMTRGSLSGNSHRGTTLCCVFRSRQRTVGRMHKLVEAL